MATADPDLDEALHAELGVLHCRIPEDRLWKLEGYAAEILRAFGMDLDTPAMRETPRRFIRALYDVTAGYDGDPKLLKAFPTECRCEPDCRRRQVIEGPIQFFALCEHRALPFFYAQRFTVQERIGHQIVETLEEILRPAGVAVYLEAHHLCTMMRGVRGTSAQTRTIFWRGEYANDPTLRAGLLTACGLQR